MASAVKSEKSHRFLSRQEQAERWGKSVRTVTRWGKDPRMGLPREYDFHGIKARREDQLEAWERHRVGVTSERGERLQKLTASAKAPCTAAE